MLRARHSHAYFLVAGRYRRNSCDVLLSVHLRAHSRDRFHCTVCSFLHSFSQDDMICNVVLDKSFGAPLITNDGVTIAKEIELEDAFENMGARASAPYLISFAMIESSSIF